MSHWLVIYDICNDKRLRKVAKNMENYGIRVQKSVFEIEADDLKIKNLRMSIKEIIKDEDYVVYFRLCEKDWQKKLKYGVGKYKNSDDKDFYIF